MILRFEFTLPEGLIHGIFIWYPFIVFIKVTSLFIFNVYSFNWSFVGINDFYSILKALLVGFIVIFFADTIVQKVDASYALPRSVICIDAIIASILVMSLRIMKRVYKEIIVADVKGGERTLVIGAGSAGDRIARELIREKRLGFIPIYFVDDNPHKLNTYIQGLKVVGNTDQIPEIVKEGRISTAIIAIAQISHSEIHKIYDILKDSGVENIKIVPPSINKLPKDLVNIKDLRDINLEDLMARRQVCIDETVVSDFISGKKSSCFWSCRLNRIRNSSAIA